MWDTLSCVVAASGRAAKCAGFRDETATETRQTLPLPPLPFSPPALPRITAGDAPGGAAAGARLQVLAAALTLVLAAPTEPLPPPPGLGILLGGGGGLTINSVSNSN